MIRNKEIHVINVQDLSNQVVQNFRTKAGTTPFDEIHWITAARREASCVCTTVVDLDSNTKNEGKTYQVRLSRPPYILSIFLVVAIMSRKCCRGEGTSAEAPSARVVCQRGRGPPAGAGCLVHSNTYIKWPVQRKDTTDTSSVVTSYYTAVRG